MVIEPDEPADEDDDLGGEDEILERLDGIEAGMAVLAGQLEEILTEMQKPLQVSGQAKR